MSKEIENIDCSWCESSYKIIYERDKVTSLLKFCAVCGEEIHEEDQELDYDEDEDEPEL
jgi:hypothetical protein